MKRNILFFSVVIAFCLLLTACQSDTQPEQDIELAEAPIQELDKSNDEFSVEIEKEVYTTSDDQIVLRVSNESEEEQDSTTYIFLEKKIGDTWYEFPYDFSAFDTIAQTYLPGETHSLELSVDDLAHELTPGEYRATLGNIAAPFEVIEQE